VINAMGKQQMKDYMPVSNLASYISLCGWRRCQAVCHSGTPIGEKTGTRKQSGCRRPSAPVSLLYLKFKGA